jgi:hypothetical protein
MPHTFAVAHWIQEPERVVADLVRYVSGPEFRREATRFLGDRSNGTVTLELSHEAKPVCTGCEKDDRREWTEPGEHTCKKAR